MASLVSSAALLEMVPGHYISCSCLSHPLKSQFESPPILTKATTMSESESSIIGLDEDLDVSNHHE